MPSFIPSLDPDLVEVPSSVERVVLLEDRARVRRQARAELAAAGRHRLVLHGVSPILQDVSLQAGVASGAAQVADVRARRALRIVREDRPEEVAALERIIDEAFKAYRRLDEDRADARGRFLRVREMVGQALAEIPEDAAWGRVEPEGWRTTFSALFSRARTAAEADLAGYYEQEDLRERIDNLLKQRAQHDRLETDVVGWLGLDVETEAPGVVELWVEYVVPCALWRPVHTARWTMPQNVEVSTEAVLWQNTGEDWPQVELHFSTSRASLGHEPPRMVDDPLAAERKDEEVSLELRQVEVQSATVEGIAEAAEQQQDSVPAPSSEADTAGEVALTGVDDGGQRRHIVAEGRHSVVGDGRPVRVPIGRFASTGNAELVTMPEQRAAAVWRVVATHSGDAPLLAGPVELVREHGPVGWTSTRFVGPQGTFELGFGPDEAIRVDRAVAKKKLDRRRDEWPATRRTVRVYLSNLGADARTVKVVERIPVSEVDDVRVTLDGSQTTDAHRIDDDGFVTWVVELEGRAHRELKLVWVLEVAPSVDWDFD